MLDITFTSCGLYLSSSCGWPDSWLCPPSGWGPVWTSSGPLSTGLSMQWTPLEPRWGWRSSLDLSGQPSKVRRMVVEVGEACCNIIILSVYWDNKDDYLDIVRGNEGDLDSMTESVFTTKSTPLVTFFGDNWSCWLVNWDGAADVWGVRSNCLLGCLALVLISGAVGTGGGFILCLIIWTVSWLIGSFFKSSRTWSA